LLIEFFEVPPDADEAFLVDWQRERGSSGATLYRAIRPETPVRFVSVAAGDSHQLVHEDGDFDGPGVIEITTSTAADAEFLPAWERRHEIELGRRGYLGARLYRSVAPADMRFVAIARWSSPLMVFRTAQQPDFQAWPFASEGALYTVMAD
jgi:heme-degrading monooxygenase HmoA